MWNRTFSKERYPTAYDRFHACNSLKQALSRLNANRLVVGHTPQLGGANCECDGQVWRIDVGMSYGVLNRPVQVRGMRLLGGMGTFDCVRVAARGGFKGVHAAGQTKGGGGGQGGRGMACTVFD